MKILLTTLFVGFFSLLSYAQDYYWVGGSGNWSDYANHWATTSGGTTMHTQAPTATDHVYFDANSFATGSQVVTLDAEAFCNNMDWTGATNFPAIDANGQVLNIYGSLTFSPDMSADFYKVEFKSTGTGNTVTTNGTSFGAGSLIYFVGIGGEWSLQDALTTNGFYLAAGTLNTNSNTIDAGSTFQVSSGTLAKTLNLGASQITAKRWEIKGTNLTLNAGTSKINVQQMFDGGAAGGPSFTYYDVAFLGNSTMNDDASFNEITVQAGVVLTLESGATFTVNSLVANGTKHELITFKSTVPGSEATFSKATGSVTLDYISLGDVHATGGASFTANNAIDNGNTTGWTINPMAGQDYYWVGNGGNWSDYANHWATTSGGTTMHSDYPGQADNVYFDANSFTSTNQTVTLDLTTDVYDMDWSGVTNNPIFSGSFSVELQVYGSVTFSNVVNKNFWNLTLKGAGNHTYTNGNKGTVYNFSMTAAGTYTLQDSLYTQNLSINSGTFNTNGQPVSASLNISINTMNTIPGTTVNLGASHLYARKVVLYNYTYQPVVNAGTSTLHLSEGIVVQNNTISGFNFNNVIINGTGGILEGSNTFQNLTLEPGTSLQFEDNETTTIMGSLSLAGTKAQPITINTNVAGTQSTLSMASGTVNGTYLVMQDMNATGGATFNATQTIDNGNNTGWNITGITGQDYFWVGDSGNWSDYANHWATTSGGGTFHTTAPGILDNVIFDANSFSGPGEVVTIDVAQTNCNDVDASAVTNAFTLSGNAKEMNIYGSVDFPASVISSVAVYNFLSTGSETLRFANGPGTNRDFKFLSAGDWTLNSALLLDELLIESGTLNTNNYDVLVDFQMRMDGSNAKTLNLGTSTLTVGSWQGGNTNNITINGGSSSVVITSSFIVASDGTNNVTLNNLTFSGSSNSIIYEDVVLNKLTIEPGKTLKTSGVVTVTANEFILVGTATDPIVFLPQTTGSTLTFSQASGTVNGDYLQLQDITATGGATFNAYNSVDNGGVFGWVFFRNPQTITFDPLPDKTYGDAAFDLSATASSGLSVIFSVLSGPATLSGNTVTLTGAGTVQIKAEQPGDINYDPAPSVTQTFTVAKAGQTITFNAPADKTYGDAAFDLAATASSGLAVSYSVVSGPATVSGSTVTITGAGTVEIEASQAGDANYEAATSVTQSFTVAKAGQTITFTAPADKIYGDADFDLTATASSGLAVSYSVVSGPATVSGSTVTITGAGTVEIEASQAGDANYEAAPSVTQTFTVAKAGQTIDFPPLEDVVYGEVTTIELQATSSAGLAVAYQVAGPVTLAGNLLTPTGAGTVTVTASQPGDDNYLPAQEVEQTFEVTGVVAGIEDINADGIRLYPLPASTQLWISQQQVIFTEIAVYDLNGRLRLSAPISAASTILNVASLERGIYLLNLRNGNRMVNLKISITD